MEHRLYSKQKGAPRHAVPCGHKSATVDGIKLGMTKPQSYKVIVPPYLLENGTSYHFCQALFLKKLHKNTNAIIAEICLSDKGGIVSIYGHGQTILMQFPLQAAA